MKQRFARLLLVALVAAWVGILLTAGDSPAQLYRYTDKDGKIVFTDNPPPGVMVYPGEAEKAVAPAADVPPQPQGARPSPQPQAGREPAVPVDRDKDAEMRRVADEEIQRRVQERQQEKQRRLEEADRLEKEAKQPIVPTQENISRQRKLIEEAERLRQMP